MSKEINNITLQLISTSLDQIGKGLTDIATLLKQVTQEPIVVPPPCNCAPKEVVKEVPKEEEVKPIKKRSRAKPKRKEEVVVKEVVKEEVVKEEVVKEVVKEEGTPLTENDVTQSLMKVMGLAKISGKTGEIHAKLKALMVEEYASNRVKELDPQDYKNFLNDVCEIGKDLGLM